MEGLGKKPALATDIKGTGWNREKPGMKKKLNIFTNFQA